MSYNKIVIKPRYILEHKNLYPPDNQKNCESKDTHFWKAFVQTTKELRVIADSWG